MVIFAHCTCCRPSRLQPGSVLDLAAVVGQDQPTPVCPHALAALFRSLTANDLDSVSLDQLISILAAVQKTDQALFRDPAIRAAVEAVAAGLLAAVPPAPELLNKLALLLQPFIAVSAGCSCCGLGGYKPPTFFHLAAAVGTKPPAPICKQALKALFRALTAKDLAPVSDAQWVRILAAVQKTDQALFRDPAIRAAVEAVAAGLLAAVPPAPEALKKLASLLDRFNCDASLHKVLTALYTLLKASHTHLRTEPDEFLWLFLKILIHIDPTSTLISTVTEIIRNRYIKRLFCHLKRNRVPEEAVEDVLQEILYKFATEKKIPCFYNLSGFLYKLAFFCMQRYFRENRQYRNLVILRFNHHVNHFFEVEEDFFDIDFFPDNEAINTTSDLEFSEFCMRFVKRMAADPHRLTDIERFVMYRYLFIPVEEIWEICNGRKSFMDVLHTVSTPSNPMGDRLGQERQAMLDSFEEIRYALRRFYPIVIHVNHTKLISIQNSIARVENDFKRDYLTRFHNVRIVPISAVTIGHPLLVQASDIGGFPLTVTVNSGLIPISSVGIVNPHLVQTSAFSGGFPLTINA